MRLTVEEDPETIKRYGHIKPGRAWGAGLCSATCPGTTRTCTLEKRHRGPHVAHARLRGVVAVWDRGTEVRKPGGRPGNAVAPKARREVWTGGLDGALDAAVRRVAGLVSSAADVAMLILLLGFVVFAIKWFLLVFA